MPEQLACSTEKQHVISAEAIRDILRDLSEEKPDPRGVRVRAARIIGELNLDSVECKVGLALDGCWLDEPITALGARLPWLSLLGSHLPALVAARLQVDGSVHLDKLRTTGHVEDSPVWLYGARIGGNLYCRGAKLDNDAGPALVADRLQVDGSVQLQEIRATGHDEDGAVRLYGARIGTNLYCHGAQLENDNGPALNADALQVGGTAFLDDGFCATGQGESGAVRLRSARIGGNLYCHGAKLDNDTGPALNADMLQVGQVAFFGDDFRATGHGHRGTMRLLGAHTGTGLLFGKAGMRNPDGPALDLRLASVNLLSLSAGAISRSEEEGSPQQGSDRRLLLDGLTYTTIPQNADLKQWLDWLRHSTPYAAQPYQQLASVHRAAGEEADARRILVAQQDDLRARGDLGGRWARARHWLLGLTIGYGYRTWRAFVGLAAVLVLAMGLGLLAGHVHGDDRWVAAHTDQARTACSIAEQVGLGVERAIPLLIRNIGVRDRCVLDSRSVPGQVLNATGWILQLAAWALATLAIAGYTGLVRKT